MVVLVEGVDGGHLCLIESEVEDLGVLEKAIQLGGLGDDGAALLDKPPEADLGNGAVVALGDLLQNFAVQIGAAGERSESTWMMPMGSPSRSLSSPDT